MDEKMKKEIQQLCETVLFDEPLTRYTSARIGGPADVLIYPRTIEELSSLVSFARKNRLPLFILGAGSNLIVRDKGIRGIVVNLSQGFSQVRVDPPDGEEGVVYAEAGVGIPRLVDFTAEEGLTGLEPLAGVPGNVGGSIRMNAGTPDGVISDTLLNVTFMDKEGKLATGEKGDFRFGYRESHFPNGSIILSARFRLARMASELVKGRVQKYRSQRVETQPLNLPNVGSVFKNPVGTSGKERRTLYAGSLIEEAGLKNIRVGGARISPKHANFIVNEGGARAKDVLALIGLIRDKVKEKFGVVLETEVKIVGEE